MSVESGLDFISLSAESGSPDLYDKWACRYEADVNCLHYTGYKSVVAKWLSLLCDHAPDDKLPPARRQKILDGGCGTGLLGAYLTEAFPSQRRLIALYGGDPSPKMLEEAKNKSVYDDLRIIDFNRSLPHPDESFDSILAAGVFGKGHCGSECIPNLIRVLKKGGYLIATYNTKFYSETKLEWEKKARECNCEIVEDGEMPYRDYAKCVVIVIQRKES